MFSVFFVLIFIIKHKKQTQTFISTFQNPVRRSATRSTQISKDHTVQCGRLEEESGTKYISSRIFFPLNGICVQLGVYEMGYIGS